MQGWLSALYLLLGGSSSGSGANNGITIGGSLPPGANVIGAVTQSGTWNVVVSNFPTTQPVSGAVTISNLPSIQPVSGTFWQAVQPVSGIVAISNFPSTQAVTGTFWPATQPVSGTVAVSTLPSVVENKDGTRTPVSLSVDRAAGVTSEALATIAINKAGVVTSATSYTVATGKRLRVQYIGFTVRGTGIIALISGRLRLRGDPSAVSISSAIYGLTDISTTGALLESSTTTSIPIADGLEFAAGTQIGLSHIESGTACTISISLIGFEY